MFYFVNGKHAPETREGSHDARLAAEQPPAQPQHAAQAYVDALEGFDILMTQPRIRDHVSPQPIRGAANILRQLASRDVQVRLSPDRMSTIPSGNRAYFDVARAASPLLWAHLHDGEATCQVSVHPEPVEAVTVATAYPDGLSWCGSCQP